MNKPDGLTIWMKQMRADFIILAVFLTLIGLALAANTSIEFSFLKAGLLLIGVVSAHISVNLFNEYWDDKTGIDYNTEKTPFSGGSGNLQKGWTKSWQVFLVATITLIISLAIGIYFTLVSHWIIAVFAVVGAISILFYNIVLARIMLGELFAGLSLGSLVVVGTYIGMTVTSWDATFSQILPTSVILIAIPPGILTTLLLLLNEFPDAEADKQGGRRHLVIVLGEKTSAVIYSLFMLIVFAVIVLIPVLGYSSWWLLIAVITLPLALNACRIALKHGKNMEKLMPALGMNVVTVLGTDLLIAIALFIQLI
ncbi:MAG: prenyltransferase [Planctomycetes bacterium]|nr:prenyltransferase [Planctomycetota bacterium]